jgi:ribosome modulation factor
MLEEADHERLSPDGRRDMTSHKDGAATPEQNAMPTGEAFRLSRIRAKGWNAGLKLSADDTDVLDGASLAEMNPYTDAAERERWADGFMEAVGKRRDTPERSMRWSKRDNRHAHPTRSD